LGSNSDAHFCEGLEENASCLASKIHIGWGFAENFLVCPLMGLPTQPQVPGQVLAHYKALDQHIGQFFQPGEVMVYEELQSFGFRVDVFHLFPQEKSYQVLLTSGLSTVAMPLPVDHPEPEVYHFAELMLFLPGDWKFSRRVPSNLAVDWPLLLLQYLTRVPFSESTCLGIGDVVHDGQLDGLLSAHTPFKGCLLLPPVTTSVHFNRVYTDDSAINIYSVLPLLEAEMQFIQKEGFIAFKDQLIEKGVSEVLDVDRRAIAPS